MKYNTAKNYLANQFSSNF